MNESNHTPEQTLNDFWSRALTTQETFNDNYVEFVDVLHKNFIKTLYSSVGALFFFSGLATFFPIKVGWGLGLGVSIGYLFGHLIYQTFRQYKKLELKGTKIKLEDIANKSTEPNNMRFIFNYLRSKEQFFEHIVSPGIVKTAIAKMFEASKTNNVDLKYSALHSVSCLLSKEKTYQATSTLKEKEKVQDYSEEIKEFLGDGPQQVIPNIIQEAQTTESSASVSDTKKYLYSK